MRPEIEAGMAVLDREYPEWVHEIDLAHLDMGDPDYCVLGQLADVIGEHSGRSPYDDAVMTLWEQGYGEEPGEWTISHGFEVVHVTHEDDDYPDYYLTSYAQLTNAWREAIIARRR